MLIDPVPNVDVAEMRIIVNRGSTSDPPGKAGLAQLVQTLSYHAADHPAGQVRRWHRLIGMGASALNGQTQWDAMVFSALVSRAVLSELLALEIGRMSEPLAHIDEATFREVKGGIAAVARVPTPVTGIDWQAVHSVTFPRSSPYLVPVWGTEQSRSSLTLEDARRFAGEHFRPENITVLLAGAVTPADADVLIRSLPSELGGQDQSKVRRPSTRIRHPLLSEPARAPMIRRLETTPAADLLLAWMLPGVESPDFFASMFLGNVLLSSGSVFSQEDRRIARMSIFVSGGAGASVLVSKVIPTNDSVAEPASEVVERRLVGFAADRSELHRALYVAKRKRDVRNDLGQGAWLERSVNRAWRVATTGRCPNAAQESAEAASIDDATMARVAGRYLTSARAHVVLRTPDGTSASASRPSEPPPSPSAPVVDVPAEAVFRETTRLGQVLWSLQPEAPVIRKLPNGLTLIVLRRIDTPAVWATLGFHGGSSYGASATLARLAMAFQPSSAPAALDLGMTMESRVDLESSSYTVGFHPEQLAAALTSMFDGARVPTRGWSPPDEIRQWLLESDLTDLSAAWQYRKALYADHPLGGVVGAEHWERYTRKDADGWIAAVHRPENGVLVVVGDVDAGDVESVATELLADWKGGSGGVVSSPPAPSLRSGPASAPTAVFTHRAGSSFVHLRLGCLLPPWTAETRGKTHAFREAIDLGFKAALEFPAGFYDPLRVETHVWPAGAAELQVDLDTTDGELGTTLAALRRQWTLWGHSGFTNAEAALARGAAVGNHLAALGTQDGFVARSLFYKWIEGVPVDVPDGTAGQLLSLTSADLDAMFRVCAANAVLSLVGDQTALRGTAQAAWPEVAISK